MNSRWENGTFGKMLVDLVLNCTVFLLLLGRRLFFGTLRQGRFENIEVALWCINCTNIFLERGAARGSKQAPEGLWVYSLDTTLLSCTLYTNIRGVTRGSIFLCPCVSDSPRLPRTSEWPINHLITINKVLYSPSPPLPPQEHM